VLTVDAALSLFAATFQPLPGVQAAAAPAVDADSSILSTLSGAQAQLTAEQWAIVDAVIGDDAAETIGGTGLLRRPSAVRGERSDLARPIIDEAVATYTSALGWDLAGIDLEVVELPLYGAGGSMNFSGLGNAASAVPLLDGNTLQYRTCLIRLNVDAPYNPSMFRSQVAHEVFHCFQYVVGFDGPEWVMEGSAAWAGETFAGGSAQSVLWWRRWINEPQRPLPARTYDAIGLYSLLDQVGVSPYSLISQLINASDPVAVVMRASGDLADRWATHYANDPSWGAPYTVIGPGAPATSAFRFDLFVPNDGTAARFASPPVPLELGAQVYSLRTDGDVVSITSTGSAGAIRFGDGTEMTFSAGGRMDFCLRDGGCACPSGTSRPTTPVADPSAFVGVGPASHPPTIVAATLEQWCQPAEPTTTVPVNPCMVGQWRSDASTMPEMEGLDDIVFTGGDGALVELDADGGFIIDYTPSTPIVGVADVAGTGPLRTTVTISGGFTGTWSVGADGLFVADGDASLIHITASSEFAGQTIPVFDTTLGDIMAQLPDSPVFTVADCAGDTMILTNAYPGAVQSTTYHRIA